jgi:hypothetical protein
LPIPRRTRNRLVFSPVRRLLLIVARASGLVLQIPGRAEIALQPVFPNAFYGSLVDLIKFSPGAGAPATAFTINRTSVRNLRFDRVR